MVTYFDIYLQKSSERIARNSWLSSFVGSKVSIFQI